ncbi:uncharacterized protein LOC114751921 [Neltuma alba]|uniref:uncharacterized protein LOC114751921 n=1 Tax=Neltuma alba TaxID=207710 RepID=UPI0010A56DE9|nr:uncharacterized protein LOC114751921 [Prosopis alba]
MESPLSPEPTPHFPVPLPSTPIQYDHRPVQRTQLQTDRCFGCNQAGHWIRNCPLKNKSRSQNAQNSNFPQIYCRCGHGLCEVRTANNDRNFGRSYFVCPVKRGKRCGDFFVKWCDDPIDDNDLRPPLCKYPTCSCGAGVCRRIKATSGSYKGRYFFSCPIEQGYGACSYLVWEDTLSVIPNVEDLDADVTPNFGVLKNMDIDIDTDITPTIDDPQDTDIPDIDDSEDMDKKISQSWESLIENAQSVLHPLKSSTTHDPSPEKHIQHHEEETVSFANISDNCIKPEDAYVEAKAEFEASKLRRQSLQEEASRLKIMLQKVEGEIISCELEIKVTETRLGEIEASMIGA